MICDDASDDGGGINGGDVDLVNIHLLAKNY